MTNVTFERVNKKYTGFYLKGHAGYNPNGPDILCSAISMAAQMTVLGLIEVLQAKVDVEEGDGEYKVSVANSFYFDDSVQTLLRTFHLALENLKEQYPEFITISFAGE